MPYIEQDLSRLLIPLAKRAKVIGSWDFGSGRSELGTNIFQILSPTTCFSLCISLFLKRLLSNIQSCVALKGRWNRPFTSQSTLTSVEFVVLPLVQTSLMCNVKDSRHASIIYFTNFV